MFTKSGENPFFFFVSLRAASRIDLARLLLKAFAIDREFFADNARCATIRAE